MSILGSTLLRMMRKLINASVLSSMVLLLVLSGCSDSQEVEIKNGKSGDITQTKNTTIFGVSPDIYAEAEKQAEEARRKLKELEKDRSLSATAKRVLAEAEEAEEKGDNELYLEKIQEYSRIVNEEPVKRAAEAKVLEGQVLFSQLKLKEAQEAVERAVELDPNNPEYLITLGAYLKWNGKYQEMEKVSLKAVSLIKQQEPLDEIFLGNSLHNLGGAYLLGGKYDLAVEPFQQVLEMRKSLLGEEHPDVAISLNELAFLYSEQGRYKEAEPLYLKSLEITKKQLGEEHPEVGISLNNLANLYIFQGRYEEAEPLYLQALEIDKKALGEEHPNVGISLNNLAVLYSKQGRYEEAEPLYLQALEITKKQLGEEHPKVAIRFNNLALLYKEQGRYEEAEPLYLKALEMGKKQLGEEHPDVVGWLNNLAVLYSKQGRYSEAEPLSLQALEITKKQLGEEHPDVAIRLNNLAKLYYLQEKYEESKPLYIKSLEIADKVWGKDHPNTKTIQENYNDLKGKMN